MDIVLSTWPLEPDTHRPSPSWWPMELTSPPRYLQQQENVSFFFFHRFSSQFVISHPELVRARSLLNFSSSSSFLILFNIQSRIFFKAFDNISSCVFSFSFLLLYFFFFILSLLCAAVEVVAAWKVISFPLQKLFDQVITKFIQSHIPMTLSCPSSQCSRNLLLGLTRN